MHVREKPPLRQHMQALTPSGKAFRWGEDEPSPENVFGDLRHSSTMPGGYESCEVTLPRKPGVDYSDLERLTTLRVIGAGGQVDGEYRLERAPRVSGDQMAISPQAVGYQAHLDDDKSARMPYIDRDITHWREMSRDRRLALLNGATFRAYDGSSKPDETSGVPAIAMEVDNEWGLTSRPLCESVYDAGPGVGIAEVYYDWQRNANTSGSDWLWRIISAVGDDNTSLAAGETTTDLQNEPNTTGQSFFSPSAERRVMCLQFFWNLASTVNAPGVISAVYWRNPTVYGETGITRRGADPGGLYASDIVTHAVQKWAPALQIKPDSIQQSSFAIPHLAFLEPTTAAEIVRHASRFSLPDWGVFDDKEFVWYERGTRGKKWRARIGPSQLEETGPQLDRLFESIIVQYQDVDGTTRTVGPPGSGVDTESSDLKDSDPENPANKLGIVRRDLLQMGTSTAAGATEVGRRFLEQTKVLDSSGRATIVGWVEDDRGVSYPYSRVRAGDSISFVDASSQGYRRIVRADHSRSTRSCSIDLDAPPDGLQALLERLGVVLVPLGL